MSIFAANSMFMAFMNKTKILAIVAITSTMIIGITGIILAQSGFEKIIISYLVSAILAATSSSLYMIKNIKNVGSILFSRYA